MRIALASQTVEVVVDETLLATRVGHRQSMTATSAEDAALEVVIVHVLTLSGTIVGRQHRLHLFKEQLVDKRLMPPWVTYSTVRDKTLVVGIAQHLAKRAERHRSGWSPGTRSRHEASLGKSVTQLVNGPVAGCIGLKRPFDESCTRRVARRVLLVWLSYVLTRSPLI